MYTPEILAPAGNCEGLKSAVLHGADAVYFGVSSFNARIMADNFTTDNLSEWVDYCHFFGVKAYLTLNTMVKNAEIDDLIKVIEIATNSNVDAFIVCDVATIELCKQIAPSIPLHFSTQFGIHNLEGAIYAKNLGAKRIILSRETPLDEIKRIKAQGVEIEVFIHGALCVSFSGNCYLSSSIDGNSGNRGRCKQPCRKKYLSSLSNKTGYFLSTNDLCLASEIKVLQEIGVDSVKIEGRLKSPEYVANTIKLYKNAILSKAFTKELDEVKASFARTFTQKGYIYSHNDSIINTELQNSAGLYIGRVDNVTRLKNGLNKVTFKSSRALSVGDGVKFVRKGVEIGGVEILSNDCSTYEVYLRADVQKFDEVRLTKLKSQSYNPTISVDISLIEFDDGEYELTISGKTRYVTKFSLDKVITEKDQIDGISNVLKKGSMPIVVDNTTIQLCSNVLVPFSRLNSIRKEAFNEYKKLLLLPYKKQAPQQAKINLTKISNNDRKLAVILSNSSQFDVAVDSGAEIIYMPYDYNDVSEFFSKVQEKGVKIWFGLPTISFEKDTEVLYKTIEKYNTLLSGVYGNNAFLVEIAKKCNLQVFKGYGFNVANNISKRYGDTTKVTLSCELKQEELEGCDADAYVYALGYLPLMTLAHCPAKANGYNCNNCPFDRGEKINYRSELDSFNIQRVKLHRCYFELYGDKPIGIGDFSKLKHNILLDLRLFDKKDVEKILKEMRYDDTNFKYYKKGML